MFSFCSRKLVHIKWYVTSSSCFLPIPIGYSSLPLRFSSNATEEPSLTIDYLVNKCGLTQESALKVSKKFNVKSISKADSVLALLNSYGLPKPCISKLVSNFPTLLSANPKKILEPKIEYLSSVGISGPDLARIFLNDPSIACVSLRNQIIPSIEFLKGFLQDGKKIAVALSRLRWIAGFPRLAKPNIEILQRKGVPKSGISKLLILCPRLLTLGQPRLNEIILQATELECDPSSLMFIHVIRALSQLIKHNLAVKLEVFNSFGWSEHEILRLITKQPYILSRSERSQRMRLDFFMNKQSWTAAEVAKFPAVLLYSMEKRIIPRCSVLQILLSKGLMKRQSMGTALTINEDKFLEKFVMKYHEELPQLLKEYKRNMDCKLGIDDL